MNRILMLALTTISSQPFFAQPATPSSSSPETSIFSCFAEFQVNDEPEWSSYGTLGKTDLKCEDGQPVYALKDGDKLITYVATKKGKTLDFYSGLIISVFGPTMNLPNENGQYVLASHVAVGDLVEVKVRNFAVPILINDKQKEETKTVRIFVSENRGKTWKRTKECKPTDKQIEFSGNHDRMYWFAIQVVKKDGTVSPAAEADLVSAMKVYVNTAEKVIKLETPNSELQQELEQLRRTVERLEKRIKALESDRKPN